MRDCVNFRRQSNFFLGQLEKNLQLMLTFTFMKKRLSMSYLPKKQRVDRKSKKINPF